MTDSIQHVHQKKEGTSILSVERILSISLRTWKKRMIRWQKLFHCKMITDVISILSLGKLMPLSLCVCVCVSGGGGSERVLFPVHLSQDIGCPVNGIREEHSRNNKKDERKTLLSVDRIENPSSKQSWITTIMWLQTGTNISSVN